MNENNQMHISFSKEQEGKVDLYMLAPGIGICFNQIYSNSWTKGDSSIFSEHMLILNFCLRGRCDVSLAQNKYAIVAERQVCASTVLPTKDFYYPGRIYEGVQVYIDCSIVGRKGKEDLLSGLGIHVEQIMEKYCGNEGLYIQHMNDGIYRLVNECWERKENPEIGMFRYLTVRLLHEFMYLPVKSENGVYFTKSQIAIVKEAEAMILKDLSKRITAKEMAAHFGISESSFKWYVKGILGESYLIYFRKKRMEEAARLLGTTDMKVIEIANAVGYENQGKFAHVFAGVYGASPLEFRRLSKE